MGQKGHGNIALGKEDQLADQEVMVWTNFGAEKCLNLIADADDTDIRLLPKNINIRKHKDIT
jgi:hypothetical protein